jgi:hypothetical protein
MSLRYGALCILLIFIVLMLLFKNYDIWTLPIEVLSEREATQKSGAKVERSPLIAGQKEPPTIESSILISEKNIFNSERKDFPIISPLMTEQSKKTTVRPIIVLYGVTFAEDCQYALIAHSGRPLQKGEREIMSIKAGERIGEYQLAKILPDRIIMETPEDTFEVLLYDPKTPKKRIPLKTDTRPTAITSTLPPPPPPGQTQAEVPRTTPSPASLSPPAPIPSPRPRIRMAPISPSPAMEEKEGGR